jgi:ribonuclease Z
MAENIIAAYEEDIRYRLYSDQPANNQGWRIATTEITETGSVYKDKNVTVEAFSVPHGSWPDAWGYRFTTPDKVIVISGDTAPSDLLLEYAKDADILIHEVYSLEGFRKKEPRWQKYHAGNHTSTHELGELAAKARPKLLVLYHQLLWGSSHETLLSEVREVYNGEVVSARDLDVY